MVNEAKGHGVRALWLVFPLLFLLIGCSSQSFEGASPTPEKKVKLNGEGRNDADGADGSDPANDADNNSDDPANDADGNNNGGKGGDGKGDRDGDGASGDAEADREDFDSLEPHLRDCGSFNGDQKVKLRIPGGPRDTIDLRDYDEGGEIRDNEVTGRQTYVFHMKYYRLKNRGSCKPENVRDVHDPDYDEVMYRALIDLPEGLALASEDCDTRAYELSESALENKFESRDNFNGGCFAEDTEITLADGTTKPIQVLRGDEKLWNPVLRQPVAIKKIVKGPEKKFGLIEVTVDKRVVRVTTEHPFETKTGLKPAKALTVKDQLLTPKGTYSTISAVKVLPVKKGEIVWNVHLDAPEDQPRAHMVLANGVVTGDLFLQQQLAKKNKTPKMTAQTKTQQTPAKGAK